MVVIQFWSEMSKNRHFHDNYCFPNLAKLAQFALALSHANAGAEGGFSIINDLRTKKRNKVSHGLSIANIECLRRLLR